MSATVDKSCTLLVAFEKSAQAVANEVKQQLEEGDQEAKAEGMKKVISLLLNGEQLPGMFITIVRYVLPSEDHTVQKLLLLYLELIEKTDQDGKILPEMILICQNLRNNLQHPNEFIRGCTLRFMTRLTEAELLEPLVPSVIANLEHRHSFVRRHAVLAVAAIYKLPQGDILLADGPEIVEKFMAGESDLSARRNAFLMLCHSAQDRAVAYLMSNLDQLAGWGDILQLAVLELVRKVCRTSPQDKGRFIKIILALMSASSTTVVYECANALVALSTAPTALRAAANCYCQLLASQSDNNVKLIVLDRLSELKDSQRELMTEVVMDILRALGSADLDIRRKTLDIALELLTPRNIEEVVMVLKKEVVKTQTLKDDKAGEFRQMLVQAIHACAVRFPDVAASVVTVLMDFLGDANTASALDVVFFLREVAETNPKLRGSIVARLQDVFYQIRSSRVCACALWIIGEYSEGAEEVAAGLEAIRSSLGGDFVLVDSAAGGEDGGDGGEDGEGAAPAVEVTAQKRPVVLSDGTYASQSAAVENTPASAAAAASAVPHLRALLLAGDFFLASVVATALTKLVLRLGACQPAAPVGSANAQRAQAMLFMVCMLRLGEAPGMGNPMDDDSATRIALCLRVLAEPTEEMVGVMLRDCKAAFSSMVADKLAEKGAQEAGEGAAPASQPDDLIDFSHLKSRKGLSQVELEDEVQSDLQRATGSAGKDAEGGKRLSRVVQLSGFSDPIYCEAYVNVHQYDITLDVTVVNRSEETMQNLTLELATMGDLKLVERPQSYTLAPNDSREIRCNIKVSSTETGVIFGTVVYESTGATDRSAVVLSDIHVDVLEYIIPASVADVTFRSMWAEFEWENKVAVNTSLTDVNAYLEHIVASTNMKCLTPAAQLEGDAGFLAANLYALTVFGEHALANISVERLADGKLAGHVRIRSKSQGIALALGDKITLKQKGPAGAPPQQGAAADGAKA